MNKYAYVFLLFLSAACELEDWSQTGALVPRTADEDPSIPSLEINGTLLHVEAYGNPTDPILMVIHGGPGGDFRSLLNAKDFVNHGFYVVFYDQRGTGLSRREHRSQFEGRDAIQLFINDLDALVNYFQIDANQKVFLLGHSWGGMLATAYINQHPEKISGAVLAEPGGLNWLQTKDYMSRSRKLNPLSEGLNDAIFPEQFFAGCSEHEELDYKAAYFTSVENDGSSVLGNPGPYPFWRNGAVSSDALHENAETYGFDFTTNLENYSVKILFLYSENNKAYSAGWAETVSAPFPNVEVTRVKNSGHEMLYFGWADMYPKVLSYLDPLK